MAGVENCAKQDLTVEAEMKKHAKKKWVAQPVE